MENKHLASRQVAQMSTSNDWDLDSYDYHLPDERIAQSPQQKRSASKLYVLDRNGPDSVSCFSELKRHLPQGALLVANNSKVVPARLHGTATGGRQAEFLLLSPPPLLQAENREGERAAHAKGLLKGSKRFKPGETISFNQNLNFTIAGKGEYGHVEGELVWGGDLLALLHGCGKPPLPPYIKRSSAEEDVSRYQTVYANEAEAGSVAAPTAGLHFELGQIEELKAAGFGWTEVTLYVGYGTFSPIRCEDIRQHTMHAEYVRISQAAAEKINRAKSEGRPVVAVGTTVVRTLEGAFAGSGKIAPFSEWVDLFIAPGFRFNVVDHLLTNFHLPRSSLLVLVSALAGRERVLQAYSRALDADFRFFSYGDAMFVL